MVVHRSHTCGSAVIANRQCDSGSYEECLHCCDFPAWDIDRWQLGELAQWKWRKCRITTQPANSKAGTAAQISQGWLPAGRGATGGAVGAGGFFALLVLANTNPDRRFNMNALPFKNENLWPTSRPTKTSDQVNGKRWLHGDYKDPAYLYNHGIYDKIAGAVN